MNGLQPFVVHIDQSKFADTVALEEISETSWVANAGAVRSSAKTLLVPAQLRPRESVDKSVHAKVSSPTLKLLESHGDYFLPRRLPLFPISARPVFSSPCDQSLSSRVVDPQKLPRSVSPEGVGSNR